LNNKLAIFLDRDGTIIEDRGYLEYPSQVVFFNETFSSLRRLSELFDLFIVTNQSGVAQGVISIENVKRVNYYIESTLKDRGIKIVDTYVCPHDRSDNCECIKPKPYFMKKAEREHDIDLLRSFVIGDHPHDIEFAENVGAKGIYVLTGHGIKHRNELSPTTLIAYGISEATESIIELYQNAINILSGSKS
jgi:D-glycero-D-manno-heptose 1,7-bisphosphate phosphatase